MHLSGFTVRLFELKSLFHREDSLKRKTFTEKFVAIYIYILLLNQENGQNTVIKNILPFYNVKSYISPTTINCCCCCWVFCLFVYLPNFPCNKLIIRNRNGHVKFNERRSEIFASEQNKHYLRFRDFEENSFNNTRVFCSIQHGLEVFIKVCDMYIIITHSMLYMPYPLCQETDFSVIYDMR